jgi:formamidopyrimidine-DNA glycosylase
VPELLEVEYYRRDAERVVGRRVTGVGMADRWFARAVPSPDALGARLDGDRVAAARRHGKLLLLEFDGGAVLGLRFGMTGRLVVDGRSAIDKLEYASGRDEPAWERFALDFDGGGRLAVVDPRRLGSVSLDPDRSNLGPDATEVTCADLGRVVAGSTTGLKARLLDQSRLAGLGNLLVDEILWRAGLDPLRPAGGLEPAELRRLHHHLRLTLAELDGRGGSHTGDLFTARRPGGRCPRCGAPLRRGRAGGRTTVWCEQDQR